MRRSHDRILDEIIFWNTSGLGVIFSFGPGALWRDEVMENAIDGDRGAIFEADIGGVGFSGEVDVGAVGEKDEVGDFAGAVELTSKVDAMADHFRKGALMRCLTTGKGGQGRECRNQ